MALRLLPDVEALVVAYLKADASVAAIAGTRVSTKLAEAYPRVNVTLITGREVVREHLDEQHLQVDAYADDKADANLLARTVRAVLLNAPSVPHARGVVTHVRTITPPRWLPDETANDRPRYLAEYGITVHPHPL